MIVKAKFVGLSKSGSITCSTLCSHEHIFWPKHKMSKEKFQELWDYCENEWNSVKIANIECEKLSEDGTPINGVFLNFEEND